MRRLFNAAFLYTILGLAGGLFYRELTHINRFTGDTQLAVVHTHFLVLGMACGAAPMDLKLPYLTAPARRVLAQFVG